MFPRQPSLVAFLFFMFFSLSSSISFVYFLIVLLFSTCNGDDLSHWNHPRTLCHHRNSLLSFLSLSWFLQNANLCLFPYLSPPALFVICSIWVMWLMFSVEACGTSWSLVIGWYHLCWKHRHADEQVERFRGMCFWQFVVVSCSTQPYPFLLPCDISRKR